MDYRIATQVSIFILTMLSLCCSGLDLMRFPIIEVLTQIPCDMSLSPSTLFDGTTYLTDPNAPPISTLPSLSISGWFLLRGYSDLYYTIYSVEESPNLLYALSYNPVNQKIQHEIMNESPVQEGWNNVPLDQWLFIFSSIQYQTSPDGTYVVTKIYKNISSSSLTSIYSKLINNSLSRATEYDISAIQFNVGYQKSTASDAPSCSYLKYISAFNKKIVYSQIRNYRLDIQAMGTILLQHLDSFYTSQNRGKIFSLDPTENGQQFTSQIENPFDFLPSTEFNLDNINASESLGFSIQFSFKMDSSFPAETTIFSITANKKPFNLLTKNTNKLLLNSEEISCAAFNTWNHIILIIQQAVQSSLLLTVNGVATDRLYINFPRVRTLHIKFGLKANTEHFQFNSIRIYQGIQYVETNSCDFGVQSASSSSTQCLFCNTGYLVSMQNNSQCNQTPPASDDANYPFQEQWLRPSCQVGMINDRTTGTCRCRVQEYLDTNGYCSPCPHYCNTCTSPYGACPLTSDQNRNSAGECLIDTFDDGFNCKTLTQQDQLFPADKSIYSYKMPKPTYIASPIDPVIKIFSESNIDLDFKTKYSFLFSFSFKPKGIDTYSNHVIATVVFDGVEVISVYITTVSKGLNVVFQINGIDRWHQLILLTSNSWFSIWTNGTNKTVFSIHSNWVIIHKEVTNQMITADMKDINICIGSCTSLNPGFQPSLGIFNVQPFKFIADIESPSDYSNQVVNLLLDESEIFAIFSLQLKVYKSTKLGTQSSTSEYPGQSISFKKTAADLRQILRGFGFANSQAEARYTLIDQKFPPSISMSIFLDKILSQVTLLWYEFTDDIMIEYFLVPFEQSRTVAIRICVQYECKDTKNARLYMYEPNFLAVFTIDQSPFQIDFLRLGFNVACNYFNEKMYFFISRPKSSEITLTSINIFDQSEWTRQYLIQLNRIMIIKGNSYYYSDISSTTNCFMRVGQNPSDLCIQPKRNYLIFGSTIIPKSDCVSNPLSTTVRFVNPNTRECLSIEMPPHCIELDLVTTFACKYCEDGYFQKSGSYSCVKCDQICATCYDTSSNCGKCHNPYIQIPPTCECLQENYFLNDNLTCEICSKRCASCSEVASNCSSCSVNRINPPNCECDPRTMTEQSLTTINPDGSQTTTSVCTPIVCDVQCETCQSSPSNCLTCKENRGAPPACACQINSYQNNQGNCVTCGQGQYMNQTDLACYNCKSPCLSCSLLPTNCLSCEDDLILENSACRCSNSYIRIKKIDGISFVCAKEIEIQSFAISVNPKSENYVLEFQFPIQLVQIDFNATTASDYIQLSFDGISASMFNLENPLINEDIFSVELIPKAEFKATTGYVIFKQNTPFISSTEDFVLSQDSILNPIQIPSIGPFFFPKSDSDSSKGVSFTEASSAIKAVNPSVFSALQGLQFIFYIFDSLQPTALFLLISIQYPPYLYSFLQIIGTTIFPNVLDYQAVESKATSPISIFSFELISSEDIQANENTEFVFKRIGLSNSLIISVPIILVKYLLIYSMIFFFNILKYSYKHKQDLWKKACDFLEQRIIQEVEVNLLTSCLSILLNIEQVNGNSWASRQGFYASVLIFIINVFVVVKLAFSSQNASSCTQSQSTRTNKQLSNQTITEMTDQSQKIKNRQESLECKKIDPYEIILTQNLKNKRIKESKTYFFFQLILKFLIVYLLYSYRDFPSIVCLLCSGCYLLSAAQTIIMKPYLSLRTRYVKSFTECIFAVCWILSFRIVNIELEMLGPGTSDSSSISQDLLSSYSSIGNIMVYLLVFTNAMYILEQICCLVEFGVKFIRERNERKKREALVNNQLEYSLDNSLVYENYSNKQPQQRKNSKEPLVPPSRNKFLKQFLSSNALPNKRVLITLKKKKLKQSDLIPINPVEMGS